MCQLCVHSLPASNEGMAAEEPCGGRGGGGGGAEGAGPNVDHVRGVHSFMAQHASSPNRSVFILFLEFAPNGVPPTLPPTPQGAL